MRVSVLGKIPEGFRKGSKYHPDPQQLYLYPYLTESSVVSRLRGRKGVGIRVLMSTARIPLKNQRSLGAAVFKTHSTETKWACRRELKIVVMMAGPLTTIVSSSNAAVLAVKFAFRLRENRDSSKIRN